MIEKNRIVRTVREALYCVHYWDDCTLSPNTKWMMIYSMVDNLFWPGRNIQRQQSKSIRNYSANVLISVMFHMTPSINQPLTQQR
jgi:hypothetical protein